MALAPSRPHHAVAFGQMSAGLEPRLGASTKRGGRRQMWHAFRFLVLLTIVSPVTALAADGGGSPPTPSPRVATIPVETAPAPATLRFFNRDIVTFRVPYVGYSPAGRATSGSERIREALTKGGPGAVRIIRTNQGLEVLVDGIFAFRILEGDLDAIDGQTFDQAQIVVAERLKEAIAASRQSGPSREFLRELGIAAAATVVLGLAVWILSRVRFWLRRRI